MVISYAVQECPQKSHVFCIAAELKLSSVPTDIILRSLFVFFCGHFRNAANCSEITLHSPVHMFVQSWTEVN